MLGVGVGFDTKGAGEILVKGVDIKRDEQNFQIKFKCFSTYRQKHRNYRGLPKEE